VPDALTLRVRALVDTPPGARRLVLDLDGIPFAYEAGQAAAIGLHGQRDRRPYSIASAPSDTSTEGTIEFLVRTQPGGGLGRHLDGVTVGARIDFEGPFGEFLLPEVLPDTPMLLIAGGTGLAPLRSLAREARARGHRAPRHLIYSVKELADVAYADELAQWHDTHGGDAIVTVTRHALTDWHGRVGRIDAALLRRFTTPATPLSFLCGPPSMVDDLSHQLSQLGVPAEHLRTEQWRVAT